MSANIRSDSGDAYHAWEDVKCDRQSYATKAVQEHQLIWAGSVSFEELLGVFRAAGDRYDRWTAERARDAA